MQLPRLPAPDRERLRDAGGLQVGSGAGDRSLQRLRTRLRRGGPETARLPLLPRLRLAGLLHRADRAGSGRRVGRLVRRPCVPATNRVGLRLPPSHLAGAAGLGPALRTRAVVGLGAAALRAGQLLIELRPDQAYLYFNTACCESLAGEKAEAIEHLRQASDMWDGCREMANRDSD